MILPRVLILENHSFQRGVVVTALQRLGLSDILVASSGEEAMALMQRQGGIDIALCDWGNNGVDCLEFLHCANQFGMVRAVILYSELPLQLHRAVEQITSFSGLELLGTLSKPVQLRPLQKILKRYSSRCLSVSPIGESSSVLPSEDDVRRGLDLGEFHAYFQPKFLLASGVVAGAEVLARWLHPTKGGYRRIFSPQYWPTI